MKCPHCKGTGEMEPNILRELRKQAGKKQSEVAAALDIEQSAYSRLEESAGRPGGLMFNRHLTQLADFFKVTSDHLLGRVPLPAPKKKRPFRAPDPAAIVKSKAHRKAVADKNRRDAWRGYKSR